MSRFRRVAPWIVAALLLACGKHEELPISEGRPFPIFRVSVNEGGQEMQIITFLSPPEIDRAGGLPGRAAVGALREANAQPTPENFQANQLFVEFLQGVVRAEVPLIDEYIRRADQIGDGWLHVRDLRSEGDDEFEKLDVVGSFPVTGGRIDAAGYVPNERYRILGPHGLPLLPAPLADAVLGAVRRLTVEGGASSGGDEEGAR